MSGILFAARQFADRALRVPVFENRREGLEAVKAEAGHVLDGGRQVLRAARQRAPDERGAANLEVCDSGPAPARDGPRGRGEPGKHRRRETSRRAIGVASCDRPRLHQNPSLSPSRNSRSSIPSRPLLAVPLMMPKLLAFTLSCGLAKCARVRQVEDLDTELTLRPPPSPNSRKTLMSKLAKPGPRRLLTPAVPNRRSVTGRNAVVSNQGWPGPMPPRISTSDFT